MDNEGQIIFLIILSIVCLICGSACDLAMFSAKSNIIKSIFF